MQMSINALKNKKNKRQRRLDQMMQELVDRTQRYIKITESARAVVNEDERLSDRFTFIEEEKKANDDEDKDFSKVSESLDSTRLAF